jgi:pimeloyl-ACP methyl ester carboxylesterase
MQRKRDIFTAARVKVLSLVLLAVCFAGCARPRTLLVVTVGGLGFSQMHDLRMAVKEKCPDADVVSAGMMDAYKTDLVALTRQKPHQHIVLIGHSFGCEAIDHAANQLPHVDLAVFIDPAWDDFSLSPKVGQYLWFKRSDLGIEREATIRGASNPTVIRGGHNDIPHSQDLIAEVVRTINAVGVQARAKDEGRTGRALASGS